MTAVRALVLGAALLLLMQRPARADEASEAFRAATQLLGAGQLEAAQAAFEAVAASAPTGPWADDALSEAAEVAERRGDLTAARRLWRRVLDEFPSSRQSRRARVRVAAIERAIGAGGEWLAVAEAHEAILRDAMHAEDPTPQVEAMEALVDAHPDYPRAFDARMWIGDTCMRLGLAARAATVFATAAAAATAAEDRWRAAKAHGDALAAAGRLDDAERAYQALRGQGDDLSERALDNALADVAEIRARQRKIFLCWVVLGIALLVVGGTAWWATGKPLDAARALLRPPAEVWYFAPVALVIYGVSMTGNLVVAVAVRWILLGGFATVWLFGAALEAARRRGRLHLPLVLTHVVTIATVISSICYLAVMHDQLIDMIAETWTHGHDMR